MLSVLEQDSRDSVQLIDSFEFARYAFICFLFKEQNIEKQNVFTKKRTEVNHFTLNPFGENMKKII